MAKRYYNPDSASLLPSSPPLYVRSAVTGGCAVVAGAGPMAGGISLSVISASNS